jgi:hypothetical protein
MTRFLVEGGKEGRNIEQKNISLFYFQKNYCHRYRLMNHKLLFIEIVAVQWNRK